MKRSILPDIIVFFFIFLFLHAGVSKLYDIRILQHELASFSLPLSVAGVIAWCLPIAEILLPIALFAPKIRLKAVYVTAGVMTLLTFYVVTILFINDQLTCSCGEIIEDLTPKQQLAFNSACVILSLIGISTLRKQQPTQRFKWVTGSSAVALFALVGWFLVSSFRGPGDIKSGLEGQLVPSIPMLLMDSTTKLKTDDIPMGKPFVVFGFSPRCKHCQALTADITTHMSKFKDIRIYYVASNPLYKMRPFFHHFKLNQYPNITMGRDSTEALFRYFHADMTPLIAIYDANKRLKKVITGSPTAEKLLDDIQN